MMNIRPPGRGAAPMALALLLVAACSTEPPPKPPPVAPALIEQPGKKAITVSVGQNGATVVLERSQALIVRLPSAPTSRLEWAPIDLQPGVLAIRRSGYEQVPWSPEVGQGTAGTAYWELIPQAAGLVRLRFDLRQPHSLDPAVQTVSYTVTVK